ncbi:MAG: hypothetical protein BV458_02725 [Thermoplasmata archaeon M9B2D]|nr:MAG: hypothetical protein BV458_02725 [Thermoplasmata archaeon M9B2D]
MTKCKDGKKHIIVKEYKRKDGTEVANHERSCPTHESNTAEELYLCCVCGEEHSFDDIHHIEIKGETKNICRGCADTVHGLV